MEEKKKNIYELRWGDTKDLPKPETNNWEKEFDKEFPPEFIKGGKDFIEISSYATTPDRIKSFINQLSNQQRQDIIKEIEGKWLKCPTPPNRYRIGYNTAVQEILTTLKQKYGE